MTRYLGGSDQDFQMPALGVFVPPNLTPDKDGRVLSPAMPWADVVNLSKDGAQAIAAYLKSLPAVSHKVPSPSAPKACVNGATEFIVARPDG